MTYRVEYLASVVRDDLPRVAQPIRKRIREAIERKLMIDPLSFGRPLRYSLKGARRMRVGDCRVIFTIEEHTRTVLIVKIGHRREVYEG